MAEEKFQVLRNPTLGSVGASLSPAGMGRVLGNSQPKIQGLEVLGGFQVLPGLVTVPKTGQETLQTSIPLMPRAFPP